MKATFAVAATAALAGGVSAKSVHHRHVHDALLGRKAASNDTCGCTTIYSTYYGEATLVPKPVESAKPTTVVAVVPTPAAKTCATTGVYTFPATTLTLTTTATVIAVSTTAVPSGTHTLGGVTTTVSAGTTITVPYATVSTSEGTTTSVIKSTVYVCPSAGTYTVGPHTTTVTKESTIAVPTISTYAPGTYTQPEITTTIKETSTVVYCPYSTSTSAAPVKPTTAAPAPPAAYPTSAPVVVPSKSASSPSPKPTVPSGNGKAPWGVTYTPYDTNGDCKSQSAVEADIAAIAARGISTVRVYSTDCGTLPKVGGACKANGVKMILGIFIDQPHCSARNPTVAEQIAAIKAWAQFDLVDLLIVGNEALFNQFCTPTELRDLINHVKEELSGYKGLYTTADTINVWQQPDVQAAICGAIDIVGAQAHAYFNTETDASQAGQFVRGQLEIANGVCAGKPARVVETGWPAQGKCNGKACAGEAEQSAAIASLLKEVSNEAVFFSLTNDKWKSPDTDCQCEQYWGCGKALGLSGLSS